MTWPTWHYRWEWQLRATPEALWPYVSDTNRFNHDTGLPMVSTVSDTVKPSDPGERRLTLSRFGVPLVWDEEPFEWVRPSRFGVMRRYSSGPLAEMRILAQLEPSPSGGTRLTYEVWVRARSLLGHAGIPVQIGLRNARTFAEVFRRYDQLAASHTPFTALTAEPRLAVGGKERLTALLGALGSNQSDPLIIQKLVDTIVNADDISLTRIRPYALADSWRLPRRAVLETSLLATRAGMLDAQWDVVCPLCRGAKSRSPRLRDLPSTVHCESCNIDFSTNLERAIELTFRPNPAIRNVDVGEFCVGGPQVTPHIAVQQLIGPHAMRGINPVLEVGRYRLRVLNQPGGLFLNVTPGGARDCTLALTDGGWPGTEPEISTSPALRFENNTGREELFILERMAWTDQAATAADVTTFQRFRDLFALEALRPGEHLSVGSLAVVFTDLRGSTRLYRQIGDATAFGLVLNHFDVLTKAIDAEDGAIVKTIGDAVMAVFRRPVAAVRAMLSAQHTLKDPPDGLQPLTLKAGIHYGPCLTVNLNDRLDYFGSTVNTAARLEGQSSGEDIVVSEAIFKDREVADLLAQSASGLVAEPFDVYLKGFDEERFTLWRIRSTNRNTGGDANAQPAEAPSGGQHD